MGISKDIGNSVAEETVRRVFKKIGVEINEQDVIAWKKKWKNYS